MRGIASVAAITVAMCVLVACGGSSSKSSSAKGPNLNAPGEGQLNMINWEGYADPSFTKQFTKETGCQVNTVNASTSDEMFTKFKSGGGSQYDVVSPSGDADLRLIRSGAVRPLDISKLVNLKDMAPQLQSPPFNTINGVHYGISFMWGANVLIYNADKIKPAPTSWSILYDPAYKGKITVPDNFIQIADPALQFFHASDPYSLSQATLSQVVAKLKQQRPLVRKYWALASDFEQLFKSGDAIVGAGWPLMTNDLRKAGMNVGEVIPKEGVTGWSDSWMVAKDAAHPICAYKWLNYVTSPKVQAKVADVTAYSPGNTKTCAVVGPARCKALHITDSRYYSSIHYWITPTSPTNLQQWNDAWAQVKG